MLTSFIHGEALLYEWVRNAALLLLVVFVGLWLIVRYLRGR